MKEREIILLMKNYLKALEEERSKLENANKNFAERDMWKNIELREYDRLTGNVEVINYLLKIIEGF